MNILKHVKPFDGHGDISMWLDKVRRTAAALGQENIASVYPILLEGPAYAVFKHLSEEKKTTASEIEKVLMDAFSLSPYDSYDRLMSKKWDGEPADVFLADVRTLVDRFAAQDLTKVAFICGLPQEVSSQMRASAKINSMSL